MNLHENSCYTYLFELILSKIICCNEKKCKSEYVMRILFWTFFRGNHLEWPLVNPLDIPESSPSESSIPGNEKENKINKLERGGP